MKFQGFGHMANNFLKKKSKKEMDKTADIFFFPKRQDSTTLTL